MIWNKQKNSLSLLVKVHFMWGALYLLLPKLIPVFLIMYKKLNECMCKLAVGLVFLFSYLTIWFPKYLAIVLKQSGQFKKSAKQVDKLGIWLCLDNCMWNQKIACLNFLEDETKETSMLCKETGKGEEHFYRKERSQS